jgi:excisionase family DNA binding protein
MNDSNLLLTTSDAAELLNAHASSVKRWASEGTLPCVTTHGGHRRFRLEDLRVFSKSSGVPFKFEPLEDDLVPYLTALRTHDTELDHGLAELFFRWFRSGKSLRAEWALEHLRQTRYTIGGLFDRVLAPVLVRVGEEWERGRLSVAAEHYVSQQVAEALYRLRPATQASTGQRPMALCAGAEGVKHVLALHTVRLVLEHQGWRVAFLGADVPNEDLADMVVESEPLMVCIGFSQPLVAGDVRRTLSALAGAHARHPFTLALGGKPTGGVAIPPPFRRAQSFTSLTGFETWSLEQTMRLMQAP